MAKARYTSINPEYNSGIELNNKLDEVREDFNNIDKLFDLSILTNDHLNNIIKYKANNQTNNPEILTEIIDSLKRKFEENKNETAKIFKLINEIYDILYPELDEYRNQQIKILSNGVQIYSENLSLNINDLKKVIKNHNDDPNGKAPLIIELFQNELLKLEVYEKLNRNNAPFAFSLINTPINLKNAFEFILTLYRWQEFQLIFNIDSTENTLDESSIFLCHEFLVSLSNICEHNLKKLTGKKNFGECIKEGIKEVSEFVKPLYIEFPCGNLKEFQSNFETIINRLLVKYIKEKNEQYCIALLLYCSCMIRNKVMHGINYELNINSNTKYYLLAIGVLFTSNLSILYLLSKNNNT